MARELTYLLNLTRIKVVGKLFTSSVWRWQRGGIRVNIDRVKIHQNENMVLEAVDEEESEVIEKTNNINVYDII